MQANSVLGKRVPPKAEEPFQACQNMDKYLLALKKELPSFTEKDEVISHHGDQKNWPDTEWQCPIQPVSPSPKDRLHEPCITLNILAKETAFLLDTGVS